MFFFLSSPVASLLCRATDIVAIYFIAFVLSFGFNLVWDRLFYLASTENYPSLGNLTSCQVFNMKPKTFSICFSSRYLAYFYELVS